MKWISTIFVSILIVLSQAGMGQYAPPAGMPGTTAIHADSLIIKDWATEGSLLRGLMQISEPSLGDATYGIAADAFGKADLGVVSLGDGGSFTYHFQIPLIDGPGPDFVVFENSFSDDFLELAHVEVSNDGKNFVEFQSVSETPSESQIGGFGTLDAVKIHNLAGKYRGMFGVPFDLNELTHTGIHVQKIHYVRLTDVVGSIDSRYATFDSRGVVINDPWPTPFPSSGFDLDALGIIHDERFLGMAENNGNNIKVWPNPFNTFLTVELPEICGEAVQLRLINMQGIVVAEQMMIGGTSFDASRFTEGIYMMQVSCHGQVDYVKIYKQ